MMRRTCRPGARGDEPPRCPGARGGCVLGRCDARVADGMQVAAGRIMTGARRLLACACAALAIMGASGCSLATPSLADAPQAARKQTVSDDLLVEAGTLTVAVNTADAPQAMLSNGEATGYAVDVAAALAQRLGLTLSIVSAPTPASPLENRTADLFIGAAPDDASSSVTVFGDYLEDATAVFAASPELAASASIDALNAATVGVQGSSASQEALTRAGGMGKQETYDNVNACFEALTAGEVQYVVCDATAGAYLARACPGATFAGTLSTVESFGLAARSGSIELAQDLEDAFDAMVADGTLDAVHRAWYGALPASLSDEALSGAVIAASDADGAVADGAANSTSADAADGSASSSAASSTGAITEDINSLSS